jgi:hypothetical protein
MKRTLTAAVIFAATVGITGLAQAQTSPTEVYGPAQRYETPGKPSAGQQAAPSVATSPAVPSNSNPYWRTNAAPDVYAQPQAPSSRTNP